MTQQIIKMKVDQNRLDSFLFTQKIIPTRSQATRLIKEGQILVNEKVVKPSLKLRAGDEVKINFPEAKTNSLKPQKIPLIILYEDKDLVVIDKKPNMVVHPGAGHASGTLVHALLYHCKGLSTIGGVERPGIVHRLDRGTSGVMVVAKNDATHLDLSRQFKEHKVSKTYQALVYGTLKKKQGSIENLIGRHRTNRKKFSGQGERGKEAITHYKVLKEGSGISLVEVKLETGRTHQIRVHLSEMGHGLLGDSMYGHHLQNVKNIKNEKLRNFILKLDRPLLWAKQIGFFHPTLKKQVNWESVEDKDFKRVLEILGKIM